MQTYFLVQLLVGPMGCLFDLDHGAKWILTKFCNALHHAHSGSSQFGVASIQHRKQLYSNYQHEYVVLDVLPLIPGTSTPKTEALHTYIEVGCVIDPPRPSIFRIWGSASDQVYVLR